MTARLVVSLSEIDFTSLDGCVAFAERLDALGVPLSLLVAPGAGAVPHRWLRSRLLRGDALVLHGYDHATGPGRGRRAEFGALPAHEARLRLTAALRALERLRLQTRLFAPPRWLGSAGTLAALRRHGFAVCADLTAVHDLRTGAVHRGRVLAAHHRGPAEPLWGRAVVLGASRAARRGGLVRLAVSARELPRTGRTALDAVSAALRGGARPHTYASVADVPSASSLAS